MYSKKIVFYIFSLLLIILVAFGIATKSSAVATASQNVVSTKQELIEEQQESNVPDVKSINFESDFYLTDLYRNGYMSKEGITVKTSDVTQYSHYSLYKDWAYNFDVPTGYEISWDKTWDEIYSITYDVAIPHDFVNLKTYTSSLDHSQVANVLRPVLLVEEINNDPNVMLTYEELANYAIVLTSSMTIDISNYKDGLAQTSLADLMLNVINVETKKVVNSISVPNLFDVPFVQEAFNNKGLEVANIESQKINNSYSVTQNKLELSINFEDLIFGELKQDYGFVYKVNVLGSKQYATNRFSKQVQLTNIFQKLLDTESNLKISPSSDVKQIESSFNKVANNKVNLQILDKNKIPLSNSELLHFNLSQDDKLNDDNIDIWLELNDGSKKIQLPISLNQAAFDARKDAVISRVIVPMDSIDYANHLNYMWGSFFADPSVLPSSQSQPVFNANPTGVWTNVPEDVIYTSTLSRHNTGQPFVNIENAPFSDNSYILTSMMRTNALEKITGPTAPDICGSDNVCTDSELSQWTPYIIEDETWGVIGSSGDLSGTTTETLDWVATGNSTRNRLVTVGLEDRNDQHQLAQQVRLYVPGYKLHPHPRDDTESILQAKMTEYMNACLASGDTSQLLCGSTTVGEINSIVWDTINNNELVYEMEMMSGATWGMGDLNVNPNSSSIEDYLWPSVKQHISLEITDSVTKDPIPDGTTINPGDPAVNWDVVFRFDTNWRPNDYYHYEFDSVNSRVSLGPITAYGPLNLTVLDANKIQGQTCIQNGVDNNLKSGNLNGNTTIGQIKTWIQNNCMGASGFNFDYRLWDASAGTNQLIFEISEGSTFGTSLPDSTPISEIPFGSGPKTYTYKFSLNTTTAPAFFVFTDLIGTFDISYTQKEMGVSQSEVAVILGQMQAAAQSVVDTKASALNESNQTAASSYVSYADLINVMDDYQNDFANYDDPLIVTAMDVAYKFQYSSAQPDLTEVGDPSGFYYHSGNQIQVSATFIPVPDDARYVNLVNPTYDPFVLTNDNLNKIHFAPDIDSTNSAAYAYLESYKQSVSIDPFLESETGGTNSELVYANVITYNDIYNSIANQYETTFGDYKQYIQDPMGAIGTSLTVMVDGVPITSTNVGEILEAGHHEITYEYVQDPSSICLPFTTACTSNGAFADGIEMDLAPFANAKLSLDIYQIVELNMFAKTIMDQRLKGYLEENFIPQEESGSIVLINENKLTYQELLEGIKEAIDEYYQEIAEDTTGSLKPYIPREYVCQDGCIIDYDIYATYREPEFNKPASFSILGLTEAEKQQQIPSKITGFSYKIFYDPNAPGSENIRFAAGGQLVEVTTWGELSVDIAPPPLFGQGLRVWIILLMFLILIVIGIITGYIVERKNKNKATISKLGVSPKKA